MIYANSTFGSPIALQLHDSSPTLAASTCSLRTVADLLEAIAEGKPDEPIAMLRATADHFSMYAGAPLADLTIEMMELLQPGFRTDLEGRRFARNSVNAYCGYAKSLLRLAIELGWVRPPNPAEAAWAPILASARFVHGTYSIVTYAIAKGKSPSQLTDDDLLSFVAAAISGGRTNSTANCLPTRFRKVIKDNKLSREFPQVSPTVYQYCWSIKVDDMPEPLRSEVKALLRWKLDRLVADRPQKMRIRPASGKILEGAFKKLYGYAVKHYAKEHPDYPEITRLLDFANKQIIAAYLNWSINDKNLKGTSFAMFSMLIAALRQHPNYKGVDFSWYAALQASIPQEPSSDLEDRRAATSAPYDVLSAIPAKIAADRKRLKPGTVGYVELLHDELIVEFFLAFAWRQRNVRECRLGTELTGNLFCEVVNSTKNVAKPEWLEKKFNLDPTTKFWQIRFRAPSEVKGKRDIRGYVPSHIIQLLEEYLRYRSLLVGAVDPGTLFLNRAGGPMKDSQVTMLIGNLTVRYAGRRVTPHHFRDAFALAWLDDHPEDYITLSKALWHATVDITIEKYGRNYDESYGLRKAGDWIASRRTT